MLYTVLWLGIATRFRKFPFYKFKTSKCNLNWETWIFYLFSYFIMILMNVDLVLKRGQPFCDLKYIHVHLKIWWILYIQVILFFLINNAITSDGEFEHVLHRKVGSEPGLILVGRVNCSVSPLLMTQLRSGLLDSLML